ncbi:disintegrin and metalloproteinase domain-containing protein 10-like [Gigantopelta aegis]|uniref:disintegrin and metalloproteinase domain-containing protein 10-like n=1 Tax=Gigantopelta aegis TaxID=1735272 RepID=UPI001B887A1C|nr:disintegrin and metalloproteinase domain-containing protein 10-like [Gigantopelta aegis]
MTNSASILINIIVLRSLSHCETVESINTKWFSDKNNDKNKLINEIWLQNKQPNNLKPDRIFETDIQFQNIIRRFNNIRYEKTLKFWAFCSHFNIYLKKQQLFHSKMTINHQSGTATYIDIPIFYVGFNYDNSLTVVHGRFHSNNFKGRLSWNNFTVEISCPNDKLIDIDNHVKYIFSCKIYTFKIIDTNVTDPDNCQEEKYQNVLHKSLSRNWDHLKKNTQIQNRRHRRSLGKSTSCNIHLIADHLYFKHVGSMNYGSTVEAMTTSVFEADTIFRSTDFDGDGYGDNIGFVVGNITIYSDPHEPGYQLQDEDLTVHHYLNRFSEYDFSSHCLGVGFTYRDFENGVVGLAWVANSNPLGHSGGVCEERVSDTNNKPYSFNTLVLSQLNAGKFYPGYKAALALTHELGHSFGSLHDNVNKTACVPNNEYGNYVMYPYVISGLKPNNRKFSACSIQNMYPVIVKKGVLCLKTDKGPICGNGIREDGEECDCGTTGTCRYVDPCCIASDVSNSLDRPCTFGHNKTKTCSPKLSPCCSEDCLPIRSSRKQTCLRKSDCTRSSYCDGVSSSCPAPVNLPDGKPCNGGRQICESGKCLTSICEWLKLKDCQCTSKPLYCHVCCKEYNASEDECAPVGSFADAPIYSRNLRTEKRHRCNANKGFCNDKHVCIMGNVDTVLNILDTFLSSSFQHDIISWFRNYWSRVCGGVLVIFAIIMVFVITYKRQSDSHVEAIRVGRLNTALTNTMRQKRIYSKKLERIKKKFEQRIKEIMFGKRMDIAEAVGRLSLLFPTAPLPLLLKVANCSSNEELAVRILLIRGYSMRRFRVSVPDNSSRVCFVNKAINMI